MAVKSNHENFLKILSEKNESYRNGEFKVLSKYVNSRIKIRVKNKYGICEVNAINLYKANPSIRTSINKTKYCINQFKETHGKKYNYSLVDFIDSKSKIKIICPIHGCFEQTPDAHIKGQGCYECVRYSRLDWVRLTNDSFIKKSNLIHENTYEYLEVEIKGNKNKVIITCKEHGNFLQTPNAHLKGDGCRKCYLENNGYNKNRFTYFAKNRQCTLYLIELFNKEESFYKIGITSRNLKKRFSGNNSLPYNYEIITELKSYNSELIWNEEVKIKKEFKNSSYIPKIQFKGYTECFSEDIKNDIINYLNRLKNDLS